MSFNYVGIDELPEKLDCPNIRILLLFESNPSVKIPESFFESMEKLQVLDLSGLSFTSLPLSMEFLANLTSLCLDQCHLEDVTTLGKLKGLQSLSFEGSTIARLPKEMGELIELRFLDLGRCSMLQVIELGVLESLVNLEELYMQNSFDQWEAADKIPQSNASLAELKNLKKLSTLHIDISNPTNLSNDLPFGKLNMHKIQIRCIEHWRGITKNPELPEGLHKESKNSNENAPTGIVTTTTFDARSVHEEGDIPESRASSIEDVIKAITDDKVCVVGVYGPGGVGKSKLMEEVERRVKEERLFDVIAIINVSRNPNLKRIQGEIAYQLGLKLVNEETACERADLLCKTLEKYYEKKILIILDNLWTKLELKEVGIPCGYDNKVRGCKLLLTSRYRNVLYIEMSSDREFQLNVLKHGDARILFERIVGNKVNDPEFKSLVDRVVQNCGGLPLLIVSVAKRLKHGNLPEWRVASTNEDGPSVKSIVELSYSGLVDERIKSLFLVCALVSGRPNIRDTLVYCMGLGLYKKFSRTIEDARDRLIMDLCCLRDSSLLLGSDLGWLNMHDLFIDVAISMRDKFIDTEWNALVGRKDFGFKEWSKNELKECTAMAFNNVGIDELLEKLDCPNMMILLLFESNPSVKILESFFESMEKLQVLDLTGLSFTSLPSSMEFLENLTSLCLDYCHLEDVTPLGKLKRLQFLSFIDSTIARLPKEMGELIELRFLDLGRCSMLQVIEPGVLESLVNLEELYMQNSFDQWEAADKTPRSNASLAELKNLKKLRTLHIDISNPTNLSNDLPFGKLNMHKIQIRRIEHWRGITKNLEL
ncbi:hypothetical protein EUGRSUZ_L00063 [Eucalyptus grandis]|uniref:NB-ARC domain-containing protein n=1 Tax=Eucalyptus grandis TaxID=71139 RepID=A0A058ZW69_EUCGR|nr:hypothetical protein EUGRSUZ_L00063 [Eucalyptus grandis]